MAANNAVTTSPQPATTTAVPETGQVGPSSSLADRIAPLVRRLDAVLVVFVLAFAFLTASFAVANSDFFAHAAVGRLLAEGRYTFGVDPFTCTTNSVYWTNHSWLFSLIVHAVYDSSPGHGSDDSCVGGIILVVAKAILVMLLAWLMIAAGWRRGKSLWIPAACTALAILTLSPRLSLNSTTLSYVYLGLTVYLLRLPRWNPLPQPDRAGKRGKANAPTVTVGYPFKAFWVIPPLCLLWVNTDSWFFLGPLTVGLYFAGELIEQAQAKAAEGSDRPAPGELQALTYVLVASVVICFLNPHHYHAFMLPDQLGLNNAGETLLDAELQRNEYTFRLSGISPFQELYYNHTHVGQNVAGFAYYLLLAVAMASFAVNYRSLLSWRGMVLLPFVGLSMCYARTIPFFAVVAAPVMALNFLDFADWVQTHDMVSQKGWRAWRVVGRGLSIAVAAALVICSIPGWIQAPPFDRRRVAFHVHVEPTWKAASAKLALWRQQGLLHADEHWFNASPEVVNYMAYFCDGQRGFLDYRLQLYDAVAGDYIAARSSLAGSGDDADSQGGPKEPRQPDTAWRGVFKKYGVRYVVLHNDPGLPIRPYQSRTLPRLLGMPNEWTPLYANGDVFIFGWKDPREKEPPPEWAQMRLDYDAEAFGPEAVPLTRAQPVESPRVREWYEALWEPEKPRSAVVNLAVFREMYQGTRMAMWQQREDQRWIDTVLVAEFALGKTAFVPLRHPGSPLLAAHRNTLEPPPPAAAYLDVRDLQKALETNPDDPRVYLALGTTYSKLLWETPELGRGYKQGFPHLTLLRQTQIATALNQAIELGTSDPDLQAVAHAVLADHYTRSRLAQVPNFYKNGAGINFYDAELRHREEQLRLSKDQPEELKKAVASLRKEVEVLQNNFDISAANLPVVKRAEKALELGLGEKAQSILEKADPKDLSVTIQNVTVPEGAILRMRLLLCLGRLDPVKEVLAEENPGGLGEMHDLGIPASDWFKIQVAVATGDYVEADQILEAVLKKVQERQKPYLKNLAEASGNALLQTVADKLGLMPPLNDTILPLATAPGILQGEGPVRALSARLFAQTKEVGFQALQQVADLTTLRAWLLLESGDIPKARQVLGEVLEMRLVREEDLSAGLAVGTSLPPARGSQRVPRAHVLSFHSGPLAELGMRWILTATKPEVSGRNQP